MILFKPYLLLISTFFILKTTLAESNPGTRLTAREKSIISIASMTAKGDYTRLQKEISGGLQSGLTINQIKEVLVHLYAYCGFPRSIRGLQTLMQVIEERKSRGFIDIEGNDANSIQNDEGKYERGRNTLSKLTNSKQEKPTTGYGAFAPIIDTFLKEHLFADIFDRDVLTYADRELVTIAVLATIENAEPMLKSHYSICLNLGISTDKLYGFTEIIQMLLGNKAYMTSKITLDELLKKQAVTTLNISSSEAFPKGEIIKSNNFTGNARLLPLFSRDSIFNLSGGSVHFEPNARTNWHYHPGGQILLVISGVGLYQEKGKPIRKIQKGDVIQCPPNTTHWHGASPQSEMTHIALGTNLDRGAVVWLNPVTDREYFNK